MKVDKRKNYYLVLDVEGVGEIKDALTYDVGGAIVDKSGHIYESFSFLVYDIFFNPEIDMKSAYYAEKIDTHYKPNIGKKFDVKKFNSVKFFIRDLIAKYGVKKVFAYNMAYDRRALNNTSKFITPQYKWFLPYGVEVGCIWHMACQVICTQKSYKKFIDDNGLRTEKGNMKTSAKIVYAYMIDNPGFEEQHTGYEDVKIEVAIMARCFRQHKKMNTSINYACWRIPQREVV